VRGCPEHAAAHRRHRPEQHRGEHPHARIERLGGADDAEEAEPTGIEEEDRTADVLDEPVPHQHEHRGQQRDGEVRHPSQGRRRVLAQQRVAEDAAAERRGGRQHGHADHVEALPRRQRGA
jgi:hypothetical protein